MLFKHTKLATEANCPPFRAYMNQRRNAAKRGIPFQLSFAEWQWLWWQSGKWKERGRSRDSYVMARKGDSGPYAVGNVFFQTVAENLSEGNRGRKKKYRWKMCRATGKRVYAFDNFHRKWCAACAAG